MSTLYLPLTQNSHYRICKFKIYVDGDFGNQRDIYNGTWFIKEIPRNSLYAIARKSGYVTDRVNIDTINQ